MDTDTQFVAMTWLEVCKLKDGGFMVFSLNDYGSKRKPDFACTTTDELFKYLALKLADATQ